MKEINQILLQPTDVLFFRDGRPMSGSLAGHTAAWPLPDVTNHALHAALHRAGLEGVHAHRRGRAGRYQEQRDRKFGSLTTAGPFPVDADDRWYFPRPADAQTRGSVVVNLHPVRSVGGIEEADPWIDSSLPVPLEYAVANGCPPAKDAGGEGWLSVAAYSAYLANGRLNDEDCRHAFLTDQEIADLEFQVGIGIDPDTGTQDGESFYTAHYLRLREGMRLGLFASALDKTGDSGQRRDLLEILFNGTPSQVVVGGQQRICTAARQEVSGRLPVVTGFGAAADFNELPEGGVAVKWVLLTPAIWPTMSGDGIKSHPGGWLPNWVCPENGSVLLKNGETRREDGEGRFAWRDRIRKLNSLGARLVSAVIPKSLTVTGWALPNDSDRVNGGAKSTHLAVPAGAVYHFEADNREQAVALAAALNWHGSTDGLEIRNRRSTLLGEKGYGLGVCGTWRFFDDVLGRSNP